MLAVNNLTVCHGANIIIEDLSFTLGDNEILTLVGPTGCGKTTILNALAGLLPTQEGSIKLSGRLLNQTGKAALPPEKRKLGMVFQDFALFPHLTVAQNVGFRLKTQQQQQKVDYWLKLLGLDGLQQATPNRLSGGQKQRVALARALAHEPDALLLDEPLSNLDAAFKDTVRWQIREALKAAGVPAIWVTHDQQEALSVGDRVGILQGGKLVQMDTPETCFSQPVNKFVAGFLGEACYIRGQLHEQNVSTSIGQAPALMPQHVTEHVDVLVRPDDVCMEHHEQEPNATIQWHRYEGASRLYQAQLDSGEQLLIRQGHETILQSEQRVCLRLQSEHPLATFS